MQTLNFAKCPHYNSLSLVLVPVTRKFHRKRGSYFFCLVLRVAVWYRAWLSGTGCLVLSYCSFTSVIMTSQRKAQCFPQRQRIAVTIKRKRIFHGVMVRIGKVEPEGWPVRSGPSFSEVQITGLHEGSTFPILINDTVIDYFSWLSPLIWRRNSTFSTRLRRMTLCCYAALLRNVAKPEVVHALRWQSELLACVLCW